MMGLDYEDQSLPQPFDFSLVLSIQLSVFGLVYWLVLQFKRSNLPNNDDDARRKRMKGYFIVISNLDRPAMKLLHNKVLNNSDNNTLGSSHALPIRRALFVDVIAPHYADSPLASIALSIPRALLYDNQRRIGC